MTYYLNPNPTQSNSYSNQLNFNSIYSDGAPLWTRVFHSLRPFTPVLLPISQNSNHCPGPSPLQTQVKTKTNMLKFHRPSWTSSQPLNLGIAAITGAPNCCVDMVHSDSISPASLEIGECFSQRWEMKISLTPR